MGQPGSQGGGGSNLNLGSLFSGKTGSNVGAGPFQQNWMKPGFNFGNLGKATGIGQHKADITYKPVDVAGIMGDYHGTTDPGGMLQTQFKLGSPGTLTNQLDPTALRAMQAKALSTGPSAWANMATQAQQGDEANQLGTAAQAQAGQLAGARSNLAMHGGLRGGQGERMAMASADQGLLAQQGVRNQGAQSRLGIGMQDESNKNALLGQTVGAQQAAAGYRSGLDQQNMSNMQDTNKFNIGNQLADIAAKNEWKKNLSGQSIAATGASQMASATENAGKK